MHMQEGVVRMQKTLVESFTKLETDLSHRVMSTLDARLTAAAPSGSPISTAHAQHCLSSIMMEAHDSLGASVQAQLAEAHEPLVAVQSASRYSPQHNSDGKRRVSQQPTPTSAADVFKIHQREGLLSPTVADRPQALTDFPSPEDLPHIGVYVIIHEVAPRNSVSTLLLSAPWVELAVAPYATPIHLANAIGTELQYAELGPSYHMSQKQTVASAIRSNTIVSEIEYAQQYSDV